MPEGLSVKKVSEGRRGRTDRHERCRLSRRRPRRRPLNDPPLRYLRVHLRSLRFNYGVPHKSPLLNGYLALLGILPQLSSHIEQEPLRHILKLSSINEKPTHPATMWTPVAKP